MQIRKPKIDMSSSFILILSGIMLLFVAETVLSEGQNPSRWVDYNLPNIVEPLNYTIELTAEIDDNTGNNVVVRGNSTIEIEVLNSTPNIMLHFIGVVTNATIRRNNDNAIHSAQISYDNLRQMVFLHFETLLKPWTHTLTLEYVAYPSETETVLDVLFRKEDETIRVFVADLLPIKARKLFPCWDEPHLRATYEITVKTRRQLAVFSNMRMLNRNVKDEYAWSRFDRSPVMSSYSVGLVIAPLDSFIRMNSSASEEITNVWYLRSASEINFAYSFTENFKNTLSWYTNTMKIKQLQHFVLPSIQDESINSWGLTVYKEKDIIYDKSIDNSMKEIEIIRLITRAIAHQWFTNLVSPSSWNYLWLNEGLARYFHAQSFSFKESESWQLQKLFVIQIQHECLHLDIDNFMKPLEMKKLSNPIEINSLFSYNFYLKAPVIFKMLENIVKPVVFRHGILKYLNTHQYRYAEPDNLWTAMESALYEIAAFNETKYPNYILRNVMDTWIKQQNYPVVHVFRNYSTGEIIVSQEVFHSRIYTDNGEQIWRIPITIATENDLNFSDDAHQTWLNSDSPIRIKIRNNTKGWVIANLEQSGYYRVNYDYTNWIHITRYLNSDKYHNIPVLNRAQIIDDAFHFVSTHKLSHRIFFNLIKYLSRELDYVAWYPMFKNFEYLSSYFPYSRSEFIKIHGRKILNRLLAKITYHERRRDSNLDKCLRQEAVKWLCTFGDLRCKIVANDKLQRHLNNPNEEKILQGWKEWTFCKGLMKADMKTWNRTWIHLTRLKESPKRIFDYLSCTENPNIIRILLNFIMTEETLRYNERIDLFYSIAAKHAQNNLNIILEVYQKVFKEHTVYENMKMVNILMHHVYTYDRQSVMENYVRENIFNKKTIEIFDDMYYTRQKQWVYQQSVLLRWITTFEEASRQTPSVQVDVPRYISWNDTIAHKSNFRLSHNVNPIHYYINLTIEEFSEERALAEGTCNITIKIKKDTRNLLLHSPLLEHGITIYKTNLISTNIEENTNDNSGIQRNYRCYATYNTKTQMLILDCKTMIPAGYYNLNIKFDAVISDDGKIVFKTSTYVNQAKVLLPAMDSQLIGARQLFPCWDEPVIKTTYNISVKHYKSYIFLSNLPERSVQDINGIKTLSSFNVTFKMSTSSLMMVMIPARDYVYHIQETGRKYICRPHLVEHVKRASDLVESVQKYLKKITADKKIPKITHVAIPNFQNRIVGHLGLIIYNEGSVIYDEEADPIGYKIQMFLSIARAMTRVWFCDVINPTWWSDLWINDGLATLFGGYAIKEIVPEWRTDELFTVQSQHESLHVDVDCYIQPLSREISNPLKIKSLLSFSFYIKAPILMHMLYRCSKEFLFYKSLQELFNIPSETIIPTSYLLYALLPLNTEPKLHGFTEPEQAYFQHNILKSTLYNWTTQANYPVLRVTRDYDSGKAVLSQENLNVMGRTLWWIPVTFTTQMELEFSNTIPKFWLKPHDDNMVLKGTYRGDEWIIANLQQAGYYRVNYDVENWRLIASYLNSKNYARIHVLNRAQLIDDAYHFMMADQLEYDVFFELTSYLSQETDYIAWYPMIKIFEYLSVFLPFENSAPIKEHMLNILNGVLEKIGYEENPKDKDLTKCLRQEAVKWACMLNEPNCKFAANIKLKNYLVTSNMCNSTKLPPGWKHWTYCNGITKANRNTWINAWYSLADSFNTSFNFVSCSKGFLIPEFLWNIKSPKISEPQHKKRLNALNSIVWKNVIGNLKKILAKIKKYTFHDAMDSSKIHKFLTIFIHHTYSKDVLLEMKDHLHRGNYIRNKHQFINIQYLIAIRLYRIDQQTVQLSNLFRRNKAKIN